MTCAVMADRIRGGDRAAVAQAITLIESGRPDHQQQAQDLLGELMPFTGGGQRVGITGPPGVGKSTLIDTLGRQLIGDGHRVAVLAVDPSSARTGGSILGDRTRMGRLAVDPAAFVRPSPSAGTLGGAARATRETILIMEAAGYDVVLVETVGVGQSEFLVAGMVDTFVLLTLARTGDELQGMKRGILEMADVIAVNKADGTHEQDAVRAARELSSALRLVRGSDGATHGGSDAALHGAPPGAGWRPAVLTCSGREGTNVGELWALVARHRAHLMATGDFQLVRQRQLVEWTRALVRDRLLARLDQSRVRATVARTEKAVLAGDMSPTAAAEEILRMTETALDDAGERAAGVQPSG